MACIKVVRLRRRQDKKIETLETTSNGWQQIFKAHGALSTLDDEVDFFHGNNSSFGTITMLHNMKMKITRIKWQKDNQEMCWRLMSSKLALRGELGCSFKAWAMSTKQSEILCVRFIDAQTAVQFTQTYNHIPAITYSIPIHLNDQCNSNSLPETMTELLKDIKAEHKSLVSGYVRMHQILNNLYVPPSIVNYIILYLFLNMFERFNDPWQQYPLSINKSINSNSNADGWLNITGITVIKANTGIYEWEFQINRRNPFVIVGMVPMSKLEQMNSNRYSIVSEHNSIVSTAYKGTGWHLGQGWFYTPGGDCYVYGSKLKHEISFVKMIFDTNELTLQYETKDGYKYINHGFAITVESKSYAMAISLLSSCTVVLTSFVNYFSA